MPEPTDLRIGDAERDDASELLAEHLGAGRLTPDEFSQRVHLVLQATHETQLHRVFRDLPGRRPGQPRPPVPMTAVATPRRWVRPAVWAGTGAAAMALAGSLTLGHHGPAGGPHEHHGHGPGAGLDPAQTAQLAGHPHATTMLITWAVMAVVMLAAVLGMVLLRRRLRSPGQPAGGGVPGSPAAGRGRWSSHRRARNARGSRRAPRS